MTPPAPAAVVPSTDQRTPRLAPRQAPHLRAVPPAAPAGWACDNCATPNAARRRRCSDCGTSRY